MSILLDFIGSNNDLHSEVLRIFYFLSHFNSVLIYASLVSDMQGVTVITDGIPCVTSLVECYEMVLAIIMAVPENVWDECYCTCSSYLHKCY